ncbi:MAG: 2-aminoethylphosphonate--pyruvate transaminase [Halobacteriovoraceae bacterium]|nr:2-aminoethylphosphonate--pyruvate transaminase [Halobacteriovoraceae bacterium]
MKQTINKSIKRNILLNPGPATTSEYVKSSLVVADICPREKEFGDLALEIKKQILNIYDMQNFECVLLSSSGTGAIESALSTCVDKDQSVLILSNGAYGKRMGSICQRLEIKHEILAFAHDEVIDPKIYQDFLNKNAKNFRTVAFVHHETTSGLLNPLEEITSISKEYGLKVLVDTMSSFAGINIDIKKIPADYYVFSSNKCLHAMPGVGIVIIQKNELDVIKGHKKRSFYFDLHENFISQSSKGQFLFTPPVQILYSLNYALKEFESLGGVKARALQYGDLYNTLIEGMIELGFKYLGDKKNHSKVLTSFYEPNHKNYVFEEMHDYLYKNNFTIYPGKIENQQTFRLSTIGDLNQNDIVEFLKTLNSYLKDKAIAL